MRQLRWWAGLLVVLTACFRPPPVPNLSTDRGPSAITSDTPEEYLLVRMETDSLQFIRHGQVEHSFENVAFGIAGVGVKKRQGDGVTPVGKFKITSIAPSEKFRLFIGINYPTREYAERGLRDGVIKQIDFDRIVSALDRGLPPPQNTKLGGLLGIHGVGSSDLKVHREINWTGGCVALDNQQILELRKLIYPGMVVEIR